MQTNCLDLLTHMINPHTRLTFIPLYLAASVIRRSLCAIQFWIRFICPHRTTGVFQRDEQTAQSHMHFRVIVTRLSE